MRKIIVLILVLFLFTSCSLIKQPGNTANTKCVFGPSSKFTEDDFQTAKQLVYKSFRRLGNCKLIKLEYDEQIADNEIANRKKYDPDFFGTSDDNIIVLTSEYRTGEDGPDLGLNQNEIYNDIWVVTRQNKTSSWKLKGHGCGECWAEEYNP